MKSRAKFTIIAVVTWMVVYFLINFLTSFRNARSVAFNFEEAIPFIPSFVIFYLAAIPLILSPYFIASDKEFPKVVKAYLATILFSGLVYLVFPVKIVRPEIIEVGFFQSLVKLLYTIIQPHNGLPSLHVSLSSLTVLILRRYDALLALTLVPLLILIFLSTLFLKMHYLLDVVTGLLLALGVYYLMFVRGRY